jgi:hypothetical protein
MKRGLSPLAVLFLGWVVLLPVAGAGQAPSGPVCGEIRAYRDPQTGRFRVPTAAEHGLFAEPAADLKGKKRAELREVPVTKAPGGVRVRLEDRGQAWLVARKDSSGRTSVGHGRVEEEK